MTSKRISNKPKRKFLKRAAGPGERPADRQVGPGPGDPVIAEVRRVRARLWKQGGGTVEGLKKVIDRVLAKYEKRTRGQTKNGNKSQPFVDIGRKSDL